MEPSMKGTTMRNLLARLLCAALALVLVAGTVTTLTGCKEKTTEEKLEDTAEEAAKDAEKAGDDLKKALD